MADFFNHGLKEDDRWSEEGGFKEVHLHTVRPEPRANESIGAHLGEEDIGVWEQEVAVREETVFLS